MDISNWINHHAKWSPEKSAVYFEDRDISYKQLEYQISRLAGGLVDELGIGNGDRVAYLGGNSPDLLILLFACARIGAIFVPLNARMTVKQHQYYIENCDPKCLFVGSSFHSHSKSCLNHLDDITLVICPDSVQQAVNCLKIGDLVNRSKPVSVNSVLPLSTPVLIAYTSGSTGLPKGAVITQETLFYSAINSVKVAEMTSEDRVLTDLPMFHVGGLTVQTLPALQVGASVTIHHDFDPDTALRAIEERRITVYLPLPKISRSLTNHSSWLDTDISSLRVTQTGSTIVPLSVMTPWSQREVPAQQIYGLTEALPPVIGVPLNESRTMAGAMGKPSMYCEVRIVDNSFKDVAPGESGEIMLKGPCVFKEYWRNPEATATAFTDGWFHTGDIGHGDKDGYIYMDDRIKNIIIVDSSNVYPADIEHILSECNDISEAAVIGKPDLDHGEVPVACIKMKPGVSMTRKQINNLFKGKLAAYQLPRDVIFVDSFPRTSLGKIQKNDIWQYLQSHHAA